MGAGLRDADNLAWKLAAVLDGSLPDPALDTYQLERAPHVEATIRAATRVGLLMAGGRRPSAVIRRAAARAVLALPGGAGRAERALPDRVRAGPLVDRRGSLPGTLCPHTVVQTCGRSVVVDGLLGDGFSMLCAGPVDPALLRRARDLGARTIAVHPDGGRPGGGPADVVLDEGPGADLLRRWLLGGRTTAVIVRPDRIVMAAASSPSRSVIGPRAAR